MCVCVCVLIWSSVVPTLRSDMCHQQRKLTATFWTALPRLGQQKSCLHASVGCCVSVQEAVLQFVSNVTSVCVLQTASCDHDVGCKSVSTCHICVQVFNIPKTESEWSSLRLSLYWAGTSHKWPVCVCHTQSGRGKWNVGKKPPIVENTHYITVKTVAGGSSSILD